jgi:hypothetical protein
MTTPGFHPLRELLLLLALAVLALFAYVALGQ